MPEPPYLMGIDFGTEGVRVGLFDREGARVGFSSGTYPTERPRSGLAEQDPGDWWRALVDAVPAALRDGGASADDVAGISVDAMSSTVLVVDAGGEPLRPAIMWMDVRAAEQAERVARTEHPR
jgi:sugar (pentulose or hexulose) kinase